jgi:hypothetical protein
LIAKTPFTASGVLDMKGKCMRTLSSGLVGAVAVVLCLAHAVHGEEGGSVWQSKAAKALKAKVDDSVALKLRQILHPTGKGGELKNITSEADGDGILAMIAISWRGGVSGTAYTTTVRWRFSPSAHVSSNVDSDTAPIKAREANKIQMDDYLRQKVYPMVRDAIGS